MLAAGLLSDAQLESVIYAGEAHAGYLAGSWTVDETYDLVSAAPDGRRAPPSAFAAAGSSATAPAPARAVRSPAILLDNWLKGRRRAVWVSKSDKLIEDAERDWSAIGGTLRSRAVVALPAGHADPPDEGILFTTYATLRTDAREERVSRVQQIVDWLGRDFDGVIVFDESARHAECRRRQERARRAGTVAARPGRAAPAARAARCPCPLRLGNRRHDGAQPRLCARLGLWGGGDFPFATRADFVAAIEGGGIAAMEVLARDLKALGLYAARSLSYEGIEYELIEHQLTPEQIRIYDAYCDRLSGHPPPP